MNVQPLIDFVMILARCPCCDEYEECHPACTIKEDSGENEQYLLMCFARQALKDTQR